MVRLRWGCDLEKATVKKGGARWGEFYRIFRLIVFAYTCVSVLWSPLNGEDDS